MWINDVRIVYKRIHEDKLEKSVLMNMLSRFQNDVKCQALTSQIISFQDKTNLRFDSKLCKISNAPRDVCTQLELMLQSAKNRMQQGSTQDCPTQWCWLQYLQVSLKNQFCQ